MNTENHKEGICPKCNSEIQYDYSVDEFRDGIYCYRWECPCGAKGKEWYELVFEKHTID